MALTGAAQLGLAVVELLAAEGSRAAEDAARGYEACEDEALAGALLVALRLANHVLAREPRVHTRHGEVTVQERVARGAGGRAAAPRVAGSDSCAMPRSGTGPGMSGIAIAL